MKLIVGLGNPEKKYWHTPHNMGFLALERIVDKFPAKPTGQRDLAKFHAATLRARIAGEDVILAEPQTYMNASGLAVRKLVDFYGVIPGTDLIVVSDDWDLLLGIIRIKPRGGTGGHRGLESIMVELNTDEFIRVRLGVLPRPGFKDLMDAKDYVLSPFPKSYWVKASQVLDRAVDAVATIIAEGLDQAMNRFNQRSSPDTIDG